MSTILIKGGTIVDGTGAPRFQGDVLIENGRIADIGSETGRSADKTLDADGMIVMPGIIDVHTHMDAQLLWEPRGSSSSWAGVTTVYTGLCGYGLAPVKPEDRDYITRMFARVEELPLETLRAGIDWTWQTFPEFLNRLGRGLGINVAPLIGHSTLRYYVMGNDAKKRKASDEEIGRMCAVLEEAVSVGAFGFSTSRAPTQNDWEWDPVPSRQADAQEMIALAAVLQKFPNTGMAMAPNGLIVGMTPEDKDTMVGMTLAADRPLQISVAGPGGIEWMQRTNREAGTRLWAGLRASPGYRLWTIREGTNLFNSATRWREIMESDEPTRLAALSNPDNRAVLREEMDAEAAMDPLKMRRPKIDWNTLLVTKVAEPRHKQFEGMSMVMIAKQQNKHLVDALLDLNMSEDFNVEFRTGESEDAKFFTQAQANRFKDPNIIPIQTDAGAHLGSECRSADGAYFLQHWTLEHGFFTLEEGVKKITSDAAHIIGVTDRGQLKRGYAADVLVVDPDKLNVLTKERSWDLPPANSKRWVQRTTGIDYVFVNGVATIFKGEETGELPGKALRSS